MEWLTNSMVMSFVMQLKGSLPVVPHMVSLTVQIGISPVPGWSLAAYITILVGHMSSVMHSNSRSM